MRVGRRVNQGVENTFLAGFHMTDPRSKLDKALEIKEKGNELLKAGETKKVLVSTPANLLPLFRGVKCEQWRVVSILKVAETPGGGGGAKMSVTHLSHRQKCLKNAFPDQAGVHPLRGWVLWTGRE